MIEVVLLMTPMDPEDLSVCLVFKLGYTLPNDVFSVLSCLLGRTGRVNRFFTIEKALD